MKKDFLSAPGRFTLISFLFFLQSILNPAATQPTSLLPAQVKAAGGSPCPGAPVVQPDCNCPTGFVAVGYTATYNNAYGAVVSNFTLNCQELNPDGTLGTATTVTFSNGSMAPSPGEVTTSQNAPAGHALVGFENLMGCAIDRLAGKSLAVSQIFLNVDPVTFATPLPGLGGLGGGPQPAQFVPPGSVIVGMRPYIDPSGSYSPLVINISAGYQWIYASIAAVQNAIGTNPEIEIKNDFSASPKNWKDPEFWKSIGQKSIPNKNDVVKFKPGSKGDIHVDDDIDVKSLIVEISSDVKILLGANKKLTIHKGDMKMKPGSLSAEQAEIIFLNAFIIDIEDKIGTLKIDATDKKTLMLLKDLKVKVKLLIEYLEDLQGGKHIETEGDAEFKSPKMKGDGSVKLTGPGDQKISGNGKVHKLDINKPGGVVKLQNDLKIAHNVPGKKGLFKTNAPVKSDVPGTKVIFDDDDEVEADADEEVDEIETNSPKVTLTKSLLVAGKLSVKKKMEIKGLDKEIIVKGDVDIDDDVTGDGKIGIKGSADQHIKPPPPGKDAGKFIVDKPSGKVLPSANMKGDIEVKKGTLDLNSKTITGPTKLSGGILAGKGKVVGPVKTSKTPGPVPVKSKIMPGYSPGLIEVVGAFDAEDTDLEFEIQGNVAGTGYDQIDVTGGVNLLNGVTLTIIPDAVIPSFKYVIINNDGTDVVSGQFDGLPEGSVVPVGGKNFLLSYIGGDGNDVTLTFDDVPPTINCPTVAPVNATAGTCGAVVCYPSPVVGDNLPPATPAGYTFLTQIGNSYYYKSLTQSNFPTAQANAIAAGGHLAVITSAAENNALYPLVSGFSYIGGTDEGTEGAWRWVNCEPARFINFCPPEPNGGAGENYLELLSNGCWNDLPASASRFSILEIEGAKVQQVAGLPQGAVFPVGTTTNTFVATDAFGNTNTCSFDVTVIDNELPVVTCPVPASSYNTDAGECNASLSFAATATDNCGVSTYAYSIGGNAISFPYDFAVGTTTVTVVATDVNGNNSVSCSFDVLVIDNELPVVTCPVPERSYNTDAGECHASLSFAASATDNCGVSTYAYSIGGNAINFPYAFAVGTTTVTVVATDVNGNNSVSCSFDVLVVDNELPVVTCPVPANSYNTDAGVCNASLSFAASATDNCGVSNYAYSIGGNAINFPYAFAVGTTTVTVIATDVNGNNSVSCSFDVLVIDNELPVVTCPLPESSYNTDAGECNATLNFAASATDNCGVSSYAYSISGNAISFPYDFAVGTTTVTVVASDVNGNNSVSCSFDVFVIDNELPVVTCPVPASSYNTDAGECHASLSFAATATDNCGVSSYAYSIGGNAINFPYAFAVGTTTVTVVATDVNGNNSVSCSFDVLVIDNELPVVTCPVPASSYNTDAGECHASLSFAASATDNCGVSSYAYSIGGNAINFPYAFAVGTTTVTVIATDVNGNNSVSCSFDVVVEDNENPTITCPGNMTVNPTSLNGAVVAYTVTSGDNCPGSSLALVAGLASGATFPIGTTTNTYKVTDASGNSTTCSFTVTVRNPYCDKNNKNEKVNVCHDGNTLCISVNALATHLAHGDQLGKCEWYSTVRTGKPLELQVIEPAFTVYPNPTPGLINVRLGDVKNAEISIINGNGSVIERRSITAGSKSQSLQFNLGRQAAGMYTIRIVSANKTTVHKVIVQR